MSPDKHVYLSFAVKTLKVLNMWPREGVGLRLLFKQYYLVALIMLTTPPTVAELIAQFKEETLSFASISESTIAVAVILGFSFVAICFLRDRYDIQILVDDLAQFERFSSMPLIKATEQKAELYTKLFVIYGVLGNLCYSILPFLKYTTCMNNRTPYMLKYGVPCGLETPILFPFRFDAWPVREWVMTMTILVCLLSSAIVVTITMLLCGVLMYITSHLRLLQAVIEELSNSSGQELVRKLRTYVEFHIALINYSDRTDSCFGKIMLLHVTGTSFIISVLGFEIIMTDDMSNVIRYGMHLFGWLCLLFVVCYFGQTLMDESTEVATAVYNFTWYDKPVSVQKVICLMLIRSQKPLTISAVGLKAMSFATFMGILSSAYSYFTMLLNFKV